LLLFSNALASEAQLTEPDEVCLAESLYLKPDEVVEMMRGGMTIGAHGHNHWQLETLDRSLTETEIGMCKAMIKEIFGVDSAHYALPYGRANPYVRSILERLGFESLCTTEIDLVRAHTNSYALPRLMVSTDALDLAGQITRLHLQQFVAGIQR
jgi:peptidoglycan/xylan/chitin deacetylase (PgdA/CDA1 family)